MSRFATLLLLFAVLTLSSHSRAADEGRDEFNAVVAEYDQAMAEWNRKFDAVDGQDVDSIARYRDWLGWTFAARFVDLGATKPDTPAGFDALNRVVEFAYAVGSSDREILPHFERAITFTWPTTYVIDQTGIIRHTDLRGEKLDFQLKKLVTAAESADK